MKLKYSISLILLTGLVPVFGQLSEIDVSDSLTADKDFFTTSESQFPSLKSEEKISQNPLKFNPFVGTDFSYSKLFGVRNGVNVGFNGSYTVSPRFILSAGSFIGFSRFSNVPLIFPVNDQSGLSSFNSTFISIYARGDYLVTPRLTIAGIAYKNFSPYRVENINPMFMNFNSQGMSLQFNYKLFENVHIGAQFNFSSNQNQYLPFGVNHSYPDNYYW